MPLCKRCPEGEAEKPRSEFYDNPKMKNGHVNFCKKCRKKKKSESRAKKDASKVNTWTENSMGFLSLFIGNENPLTFYF